MPFIEGSRERPYYNAGEPDGGATGTLVGVARVGSLLIDTTNGKVYMCTNDTVGASFAWTLVGPPDPA